MCCAPRVLCAAVSVAAAAEASILFTSCEKLGDDRGRSSDGRALA